MKIFFKKFFFVLTLILFTNIIGGYNNNSFALYNAEKETEYEFAGYLIIGLEEDNIYLCGVNFLDKRTVITAAHCVEEYKTIDVNKGNYSPFLYSLTSPKIKGVKISPEYVDTTQYEFTALADIAVIILEEDFELEQYAQIASPKLGCNYYITGYGQNEDDEFADRRGTQICIDEIDAEKVTIKKAESFICSGDSGSGIYEEGTNKLVAIISSYDDVDGCEFSDNFYATRVDANRDFIQKYQNEQSTLDIYNADDNKTSGDEVYLIAFIFVILCFCCCSLFLLILILLILLKKR